MDHTGKHRGIEKGMDDYDKEEIKKAVGISFSNLYYSIIQYIKLKLNLL